MLYYLHYVRRRIRPIQRHQNPSTPSLQRSQEFDTRPSQSLLCAANTTLATVNQTWCSYIIMSLNVNTIKYILF